MATQERCHVVSKPRICLLYTGGTIGMIRGPDGLKPPATPQDFLALAPELRQRADVDLHVVMNKDSTNVHHEDWTAIAQAIWDRRHDGYDGFIVTHGTDTMHFSASAVAFALGRQLPFPVVFTGAQTIPEIYHGDVRPNLLRAVEVACSDLAEVVICFGDYVFRGCRAQKKHENRFDAFESPAMFPLAYVTEEIILNPGARRRQEGDLDAMDLRPDFSAGVCSLSLIPGLEPSVVEGLVEMPQVKGVILQSFGAGNVPDGDRFGLTDVIRHATDQDKPIIVTSQFPANSTLNSAYATAKSAVDAGAIPTGNMTASCAVAKFRWALAAVHRAERDHRSTVGAMHDWMERVFVGEMDA